MKKILLVIFSVIGFAICANADDSAQCKIYGTIDGSTATVSIESYDEQKKEVTVGFYNDSDHVVTVIAKVKDNGNTTTATAVATVQPRTSISKTVKWSGERIPCNISINSAKCQK